MKIGSTSLVVVAMLSAPAMARAAPPVVSSVWKEAPLDLNQCLATAQVDFGRYGYQNIVIVGHSVLATTGDYGAAITCAPGRGVATFFVAGPNYDVVQAMIGNLNYGYR
ncbi:hypothetical protein [Sorangium sp. So ce693]|uniref:hypothetical protein n=1 Tax=Sorangium sp. So ce693 TaxID=3133318 RepID=UPI003F5D57CD